MRTHDEIFQALAAPFPPEELRERPKGGRMLKYITARTARRRLNEVLGPFHWSCSLDPAERWVLCSITITLDDGTAVTREAMGGYPSMPDEEDSVKGGDSDAFKRCCVLFGIGEFLYDETHDHAAHDTRGSHRPSDEPRAEPPRGDRRDAGQSPTSGAGLFAWVSRLEEQHGLAPKTLVKSVDQAFGPQSDMRYPRMWKDWSPNQVRTAVEYVQGLLSRQQHQESNDPPY